MICLFLSISSGRTSAAGNIFIPALRSRYQHVLKLQTVASPYDGNICTSGIGELQPAWSRTHLATFKPKWSHTVELIGDRLHTRGSSGQISMERCFSKQTASIWTSLTELTHLEGSGFRVCHTSWDNKADSRFHMRKADQHFNSSWDVHPPFSCPFMKPLLGKESHQAGDHLTSSWFIW